MKEAKSHVYAYYIGNAHLVLKVWQFIGESVHRPVWLYPMVSPKALALLKAVVRKNLEGRGLILRELDLFSPDLLWREEGASHLKRRLAGLMWQARKEGAERVCLVIDVQHQIEKHGLGNTALLKWERCYHEACRGVGLETLCLYESQWAMTQYKTIGPVAQIHDRMLAEMLGQE